MPHKTDLNRRKFLQQLGSVLGTSAAARLTTGAGLSVALAYPRLTLASDRQGKLLSTAQLNLLASVAETILPKTDTPGASDVDCHGFVDNQLFHCHTQAQQQDAVKCLAEVEEESQDQFKSSFELLTSAQRTEVLTSLEQGSLFDSSVRTRFKFLKSLIVFGYFTSEAGVTQALAYQPVPGGFKGSIPCDENTKAWGSLAFY